MRAMPLPIPGIFFNSVVSASLKSTKVPSGYLYTLLIEELAQALWTDQGGRLSFMDFVDAAHRFSREVEHSDSNKAVLEKAMVKRPGFALRRLLAAVNSDVRGQDGEQPENNGQYGEMAL